MSPRSHQDARAGGEHGERVERGEQCEVGVVLWRKVLRAIKVWTWQAVGDGKYIQKEVPGPANFDQYTIIWRVFVVAALMSRHVRDFALDAYYKNVEKLLRLWPNCWHLVYEADDHMRAEHVEQIRSAASSQQQLQRSPPWCC